MHKRLSILFAVFAALFFSVACSSPDDGDEIAEPDVGNDVSDDVGEDIDDGTCTYQMDCDDDEYCHDGQCFETTECEGLDYFQGCINDFKEIDEDLAARAYCDEPYCRVACNIDQHCRDEHLCSDQGRCIPFTGELTDEHPGGDESAPLQAGIGNALMHFPIGLSIAGYGNRAAIDDGRYGKTLAESHGKMHGLYARGVALDDGERQLIFLRAPIIFPTMALHEGVARKLQEETGSDWRSSLVISGTHTHSGPARFWQLPEPEDLLFPLGLIGIDDFHEEAYGWLVDSLAEAAFEALDDLAPAKMGWDVVEAFDMDDVISSDRWSQTPAFDDNRALLLRIDDLEGNPRGLLVSFGSHGTVHSGPLASADVMVGIERQLEYALGDEYGTYAPVMYFNQNGGSMSPRGGSEGHREAQRFEAIGAYMVDRTFEAIRDMEMTDDWSFNGQTHRFPVAYEYFDYDEGAFQKSGEPHKYGGLMCPSDSGDHHSHDDPDSYGCLLGITQVLGHRPMEIISRSQVSAFQLNDLTIVTMPGELTMPLGWQIQKTLRDTYDIDPFNSFTWGYAQDHMLYLVPTNLRGDLPPFPGISTPQAPDEYEDYAFSYLQGGYEAQMSPWGHKFGDFLIDRAVEVVGLMRGESIELQLPPAYPEEFSPRGHESFPTDFTPSEVVGTITESPDGPVERREFVEVAWIGGDPGAERPQAPKATLERLVDDEFEPVILRNHVHYDNREFVMFTRIRRTDDEDYEWVIYWEEFKDFPTGTYRFRIDGHYLDEDDGERTSYQSTTDPFDIVPSTALIIDELEFTDTETISFRFSYPSADEPSYGAEDDDGGVTGSFRMHHREVPSGEPIPVDADLDYDRIDVSLSRTGAPLDVESISVTTEDGGDGYPITRVELHLDDAVPLGSDVEISIDAFDNYENSASISTTLEHSQ